MATESSAIARLVDAAQKREMPGNGGLFESPNRHSNQTPPQGPGRPPHKQTGGEGSALWLLLVAVVVIGGAVLVGYLLAQEQGNEVETSAEAAPLAAGEGDEANPNPIEPSEVAASVVLPPVPEPTSALVLDAAPAEALEEELEPALGAAAVALAAKTGFDILVEPKGAIVTLDGNRIGASPLRVRNLLPGVHRIDIEGPEGYFGQHQEFNLAAGDAMVLRLSLDTLNPVPAKHDSPADTSSPVDASIGEPKTKSGGSRKPRVRRNVTPNTQEEQDLASAGEVSLGTLMLGAKPPCEIVIDGKNTGLTTPQRSIQLSEGIHRIVLINDAQKLRKSFKVRIKSGRTTRAIQDLTKKR